MADPDLDVFALAHGMLPPGAHLTSDQLAQLRALNTRHFTARYALSERARRAGRLPTPAELAELDAEITTAVRSLVDERKPGYDGSS